MGSSSSVVCPIAAMAQSGKENGLPAKVPCEMFRGSKLLEAMKLLKEHPVLHEAFFNFFRSGRWIHQFLSSNPNLATFVINHGNAVSQFFPCEDASLLSTISEDHGDVHENVASVFLSCCFPIFMQSSEFQLWLEKFTDEQEAVEKEVIHMDTMEYRRFDDKHNVDDFTALEEIQDSRTACSVSSITKSLKFQHRRKSHMSCEIHMIRAETEVRMRSLIRETIQALSDEKLLAFSKPRHWIQRIDGFLNSSSFPIVIAKAKICKKGLVSGLFADGMRVIAVNDSYKRYANKKKSQIVGRSFSEVVLKKSTVVSKEHIVPKCSEGADELEGVFPYKLTLERTNEDGSVDRSILFIKPVHHVLADPEYNYVVALQYDMVSPSCLPTAMVEVPSHKSYVSAGESSKRTDSSSIKSSGRTASSSPRTLRSDPVPIPVAACELRPHPLSFSPPSAVDDDDDEICKSSSPCCLPSEFMEEWFSRTAQTTTASSPITSRRSTAISPSSPQTLARQLERDLPLIEDTLNLLSQILY